jgi:hypothetical protein
MKRKKIEREVREEGFVRESPEVRSSYRKYYPEEGMGYSKIPETALKRKQKVTKSKRKPVTKKTTVRKPVKKVVRKRPARK